MVSFYFQIAPYPNRPRCSHRFPLNSPLIRWKGKWVSGPALQAPLLFGISQRKRWTRAGGKPLVCNQSSQLREYCLVNAQFPLNNSMIIIIIIMHILCYNSVRMRIICTVYWYTEPKYGLTYTYTYHVKIAEWRLASARSAGQCNSATNRLWKRPSVVLGATVRSGAQT